MILASTGHPGICIDQFAEGNHPHELDAALADFDNVTAFHGRFQDASQAVPALDLLHLDADHSYEGTAAAFDLYARKVNRHGHVVLHDVWGDYFGGPEWPGVTRFVGELLLNEEWVHVRNAGRSAAFRRL